MLLSAKGEGFENYLLAINEFFAVEVTRLWEELGEIPINDDGEILSRFIDFPPGTHREEIWRWFEEELGVSVVDLMKLDSTESSTRPASDKSSPSSDND